MTKNKDSKEKLEDLEMMTALNRRPSNQTSIVTMDPQQPADFADCINNQHTAQRRRGHSHHSLVNICLLFKTCFIVNIEFKCACVCVHYQFEGEPYALSNNFICPFFMWKLMCKYRYVSHLLMIWI